ncbi:hypothetical protein FBR4_2467 [Lactiplantibacillus plantarum]|uniref:DUF1617 family protein n=1 Tax=Lactiplantibacillus plantarum TaxID=1590 RepID=UPI0007AB5A5E|nr:DUF1617 family protein [Lactiplantibacillus plantarum]KZD92850.1 hypothetical protein FBR4_2467 [Lactiplantibacillus plantarum]
MKNTIEFKNSELTGLANVLGGFKLKGKASLGRTVLIRKFAKKQEEINDDLVEIQKKYFDTNEDGSLRVLKDSEGKLIPKSEFADKVDPNKLSAKAAKELDNEINDLNNEVSIIDFSEYSPRFKALKDALENYPYELESDSAIVYERVYDQLEQAFNKGEK